MPYKTQEVKYDDPFLDKRCKLLPCQKEMVLHYRKEGWSQRELARHFNVSRRLIQFILDPEKLEKNYQVRIENGGSKQYYDKEKHTEAIRNHRRRKHKILK
jgi:phage pi2 protein 07